MAVAFDMCMWLLRCVIEGKGIFRGTLHEISLQAKLTIFGSVSSQSVKTVDMKCPELKLIAGVISTRSFWPKWDFILSDKCCAKIIPKWKNPKENISACEYFIKTKMILDQEIKTKMNLILFHWRWKLILT